MGDKPQQARKLRHGWLMGDTQRQVREFEAAVERRNEPPVAKPVKRPEQLFDEIDIEEEER